MNLLGIGARSMSPKNVNRAALHNARLIASMAAFYGSRLSGEIESRSAYSRD